MRHFAALGFKPAPSKREYGHRPGMATPGQIALIRALWGEYTGGEGQDLTLGKWLHRTFGVSAARFLTRAQAPKAIGALKAMTERKAQTADSAEERGAA